MLPRRRSTNVTPTFVLPPPTSGFANGRQPPSLITNRQQLFRASTTRTIDETESPVSEIESQDIPPAPAPSVSFPRLPSSNSGLRRGSARHSPHETHPSVLEDVPPPQPQDTTLSPTPPAPQISEHPSTSTRPHQLSPGGVVGSERVPSSQPSRDFSRHSTADYPYRFDTMPSLRSDSGPARCEPMGMSEGMHAGVWPTYNKVSQEFDEKRLKRWNEDLDVLLIFAALFSAIVTAFLVRALDDLEPDYQQQSALLLHQLLNGRDPNLANISDPTIRQRPTSSAIAVNCLWFTSLSTSLGASLCAIICKGWLTEYNSGANPVVGLLRACKRHMRFMAFQRLNVHTLVTLLPVLLHSSVLLFFAGAAVYLSRMDERVAIVFMVIGGTFGIAYFLLSILPFVTNPPFRPYSMFFYYRLSVAIVKVIGRVIIPIGDIFAHICYLILRCLIRVIIFPFAQTILSRGLLHRWYMRTAKILPGEYKHMRVWWTNSHNDPLDEINTSQRVQEEAILWLSQVPLDPSESKALVSSLALISSSRPYRFQKPVIVFLNLVLEASFRERYGQERTDTAIDCILVLGHIKFQLTVDQNSDQDHNVGCIPVTALVAWAAQQLTIDAFQSKFNTPHSEGVRARLLTAAAWLSPTDGTEDVEWSGGEKLKIQDRREFIEKIKMILEQHVRGDKPLDNKVLIKLIHGMHACIPRGNYGSASSITSFLPLFCEDYDSPWSQDEAVLRALITYALDLLSPRERVPLVEREIKFRELASELIDALMVNTTSIDVVVLGFWLIYRVPYAFKSRKTLLTDIGHIWTSANEVVPEDSRERLISHAVDAFVAIAQFYATVNGTLPKLRSHTFLMLLNAALEYDYRRPMATYATAIVLNLGPPAQVTAFMNEIKAELFREALFNVRGDLERNATEEDVVDLHIYSTLVLLKFRSVELDVGKVKGLIGKMEKAIEDPSLGDSGVAGKSEADTSLDLDRVRWKAIYLSALLFAFLPEDEREKYMERFRARVQGLLQSGGLPPVGDCRRCLEPLGMNELRLENPPEQQDPGSNAFEAWIDGFPLFPLAGSVSSVGTQ